MTETINYLNETESAMKAALAAEGGYAPPSRPYNYFTAAELRLVKELEKKKISIDAIRRGIRASVKSHRSAYPREKKRPALQYCLPAIIKYKNFADRPFDPGRNPREEKQSAAERRKAEQQALGHRLRLLSQCFENALLDKILPGELFPLFDQTGRWLEDAAARVLEAEAPKLESVRYHVKQKNRMFTGDFMATVPAETVSRKTNELLGEYRKNYPNAKAPALAESVEENLPGELLAEFNLPEEWL